MVYTESRADYQMVRLAGEFADLCNVAQLTTWPVVKAASSPILLDEDYRY